MADSAPALTVLGAPLKKKISVASRRSGTLQRVSTKKLDTINRKHLAISQRLGKLDANLAASGHRFSVNSVTSQVSRAASRASSVTSGASNYTVGSLQDDIFARDFDELVESLELFARELNIGSAFNNDWELFRNTVNAMRHRYNDNPFHNFRHGFSVANVASFFVLHVPEIKERLSADYQLAFVMAALGHDLDHPGNDNSYEINSHSELAEIFSQQSVLENHHYETFMELMAQENTDLFQYVEKGTRGKIMDFIKHSILGTDMAFHKKHITTLRGIKNLKHALLKPERMDAIMQAVLHACDLSGQVLSLRMARSWENRIVHEMKKQAEKSKENGVVMPSLIKKLVDNNWSMVARAEVQLGFIDHVLLPLWKEVANAFPTMETFHDNLKNVVRPYYILIGTKGLEAAAAYFDENADLQPFL